MVLQPGKRFGRYELVYRLGYGGMAETWRARLLGEESFTKTVLIKKVLPEYADDYAFTTMLISEARISATLTHNNIAQVFDFGRVGSEYFLAMEFVDGQPLHAIIPRVLRAGWPAMPVPAAVFIGVELCRGLHYAHTRKDESGKPLGIIHRDISPENVLVSYEGQVKIVDFGLAKARELRGFNTEPGVVKGKYLFFSPEQARGEEVDARTDVWATGIVLYEMLCGKLPVEGPEYVVLPRLSQGEFPRPRELNPRVPKELEDVLMRALAVRREDRYESCRVFGDALADILYTLAPRFSGLTLSHFIHEMFREELTAAGQDVLVPRSFQEELASWRAEPRATSASKPPSSATPSSEKLAIAAAAASPPASKAARPMWQWGIAGGTALLVLAVGVVLIAKRMPKPEVVEAPTELSPSEAPEPPSPPNNTKPPPAASSADYERTIQRAKSAFASRRYQVAATNYRMALKLFPDSQEAKEGLGFSLVLGSTDDESFEEAVKLLREVVNQNSLNAGAWFALGMALQGTQEEDEAIEAYKQYLVLEPAGRFSSDARRALNRLGAN